jgi:uncharacterized protein
VGAVGVPEPFASPFSFFIADIIKILFLLFVMIGAVGVLRTYLPQDKIKKILSGKKAGIGNLFASIFGALTPFCSCSSIPLFLGFIKSGVPLGVTFSFLITSPLVNEYIAVIMFSVFGWKIAVAYILSGILLGVILGFILGKMGLEKHLEHDIINEAKTKQASYSSFTERLKVGFQEGLATTKKLWVWIVLGVGLGAVIHNAIPDTLIHGLIEKGGVMTVPLAVILGVPLYGSCAAIVPIALVLFEKGIPIGTALAFMMAIAALSLPEAIILRRAMKLRLIAIFFGIVTAGIILTGFLFNALQGLLL